MYSHQLVVSSSRQEISCIIFGTAQSRRTRMTVNQSTWPQFCFSTDILVFLQILSNLTAMLSLGSDSDTQDYTYDPNLLQESLVGIFPLFMLPSHTCDRFNSQIHFSNK